MTRIRTGLYWVTLGGTCLVLLLGPWCFGAWETWWFWPFVVVLSLSTAALGLRLLLVAFGARDDAIADGLGAAKSLRSVLAAYVVFVVYAAVRSAQAEVHLDAERAFLLFLTPLLVAIQVVVGLETGHARWLLRAIFINLLLLALYGLVNHAVTGSRLVLWEPCYAEYEGRATGSYFCPDHYSGLCELLAALCLGVFFSRETRPSYRYLAVVSFLVAVAGIVLSQSRGGGLTLIVMLGAIFVCGMWQWPKGIRWYSRGAMASALGIMLIVTAALASPYLKRFQSYVQTGKRTQTFEERCDTAADSWLRTPRGRMISAAIRSWRTARVWGIGPGMHRHVWPHIAPTADGDRETNRWPTLTNHHFHSFEVHSDWVQLLQEHGLVGFALFLAATAAAAEFLLRAMRREMRACETVHWVRPDNPDYDALLGGALAVLAMTFHSLGDFNLQMPATTWVFAAIVAIALRAATWGRETGTEETGGS